MSRSGPPPDDAWEPGTVCVLVTLGADGAPFAIPASAVRRAGRDRVLIALAATRDSLARLAADPRAALLVMARDVAHTARGTITVVEAGPPEAESMHVLALNVSAWDDHTHPQFHVDGPVPWHADPDAAPRDAAVHRALARLA